MTKLRSRGHDAAASFLVPSIALLVLSLALLAVAVFPASGFAADDEGGDPPLGPALSVSPDSVQFEKTTIGSESQAREVDVYNAGIGAAIDKIAIEGIDPGDFKVTGGSCGWLGSDQHCSVRVSFSPSATGDRAATLTVQTKEAPAQTVSLSGTGVVPRLSFSPSSYDFGIQRVNRGESSTYLQLSNVGEAATQVGSIGVGGKDHDNFWTNGGDCWNGRWLQPGESCGVQVVFNPWDTVAYEAELQAGANGSTFSATLSGTGGRAEVEPGSTPSNFAAVTVGAVGPVETIVFTNHGSLPGNFFIGIVAGGDAGSFLLLDEDCSLVPLAPAASCVAHVRFVPQSVGPKLARLALFGDDDGGTMALLSGEGVAAEVTLAPSSFAFDLQAAGTRSVPHAFAIRNEGDAPLDLDGAAVVGADLDQFALAGDECTGATLAPGEQCLVRVRFAPDGAGEKTATLRVRGSAGAFSAALSGTGVAASPGSDGAAAGAATASQAGEQRPIRPRFRHRRFSRGASLPGVKRPRPRRIEVRASTAPR